MSSIIAVLHRRLGRPARTMPPTCTDPDIAAGLMQLELAMLELRSWAHERERDISARVDGITDMVAGIADQVR